MALIGKIFKFLLITVSIFAIYIVIYSFESINTSGAITIPKGSSALVVDELAKQGYQVGYLDQLIIKALGGLKYGKFELDDEKYSRLSFYLALQNAKSIEIEVTLIPGETLELFLRQIADKNNMSLEKLKREYYANTDIPDGVIMADSYSFKHDITEEAMMDYLISFGLKKHKEMALKLLGRYEQREWFDKFVVIASIIQKEAANTDEMPLVSSVIYNRLAREMPLQMDGSLNYGLYSHKKITPDRIRSDNSTYNTYKNKGLPAYPVCSVSKEALKAAVNPAKTSYLYFMRNTNGLHTFTKVYSEHNQIISNVKKSNTN